MTSVIFLPITISTVYNLYLHNLSVIFQTPYLIGLSELPGFELLSDIKDFLLTFTPKTTYMKVIVVRVMAAVNLTLPALPPTPRAESVISAYTR